MLSLANYLWTKRVRLSVIIKQAMCAAAFIALLSASFASNVIAQGNDTSVTGIAGRGDSRAIRTRKKRDSNDALKMAAEGKLPPSRVFDFVNVDAANSYHLGALPPSVLKQGDADDNGKRAGKRLRIGVARDLSFKLDALKSASVYSLPDGEVRIFSVVSDTAKQVRLFLTDVDIPAGGRLYIYSRENPEEVFGPYTGRGLNDAGEFWTPPVRGESAVVELFLPESVRLDRPAFTITKINHIFRNPDSFNSSLKNEGDGGSEILAAGACNLNVTSAWAQIAKSVGQMQFSSTDGEYVCTGTLLNSVNNDLTPYFLTANHCISTPEEAQSLLVRWFYDSANSSSSPSFGAGILRTGYQSDFTLLMIGGALPSGLFWSGWSPSVVSTNTNSTAIHHPQGDYKRISFGKKIGNYDRPDEEGDRSLHQVRWNANGGTTEGGSSGSGLWIGSPTDARFVGNLLGGAASCDNLTGSDYYGRFDVTYPQIADLLAGGSDDEYEDNDTRETARELSLGLQGGLVVKSTDEDWYRITVPAGSEISLRVDLSNASNGDIDAELYRAGSNVPIASSYGTGSNEYVRAINYSDSPVEYSVRVYLASDTRNGYDYFASLTNGNPCNFNVTPPTINIANSSTTGNVTISSALGQCTWSARSNADWINITSGANGSGNGSVAYQVAPNTTSTTRTGTLTVAGQTITVTQSGIIKKRRRAFANRSRSRLR